VRYAVLFLAAFLSSCGDAETTKLIVSNDVEGCYTEGLHDAVGFWNDKLGWRAFEVVEDSQAHRLRWPGKAPPEWKIYVVHAQLGETKAARAYHAVSYLRKPVPLRGYIAINHGRDSCDDAAMLMGHEIGHHLMLLHRQDEGALMYPALDGGGWDLNAAEMRTARGLL